jgi:hypothetical protein
MLNEAREQDWSVVPYKAFIGWVREQFNDGQVWVVLDKVFPPDEVPGPSAFLDLHRPWPVNGRRHAEVTLKPEAHGQLTPFAGSDRVTILDDAAYTGNTVRAAIKVIMGLGGTLGRVVTCVARPTFLRDCAADGISVNCLHTALDGQDILHFRDFFPWLPFSGRRVEGRTHISGSDQAHLTCRLAPATFLEEDWLHVKDDDRWCRLILDCAHACVAALDGHLGRRSRVADLPLLGHDLAIPIARPEQILDENTPLSAFL